MMDDSGNWRLKAELAAPESGLLDRLRVRIRGRDVAREAGVDIGHDVAITHDGNVLFVYAATRSAAEAARKAIHAAVHDEAMSAKMILSHWDATVDEWHQIDPPPDAQAARREEAVEHDMQRIESRTLVISSGKVVRAELETTMREWARKLGVKCEVIEHPHLLTTQVAFTVTGPRRKLDEFADGLRAEEVATMRTERAVMLSPL